MDGDNRMIEGWDKILIEEIGVELMSNEPQQKNSWMVNI